MILRIFLTWMAIIKKSTNNKCWRGCEEKGTFWHFGGNVNWCSHYGKLDGVSLKNIQFPYDPAIPFLGTYIDRTVIGKDTCTPMFRGALFTAAKTWKQPKCPLTEEWIKMWCVHTCIHTDIGIELRHRKEWNTTICSNMNGPRDYHTRWNHKDKYHMISLTVEI